MVDEKKRNKSYQCVWLVYMAIYHVKALWGTLVQSSCKSDRGNIPSQLFSQCLNNLCNRD